MTEQGRSLFYQFRLALPGWRTAWVFTLLIVVAGAVVAFRSSDGFFVTGDQRGQRMLDSARYADAAEAFRDPFRRGEAMYRDGDFKRAAVVFGGLPGPDAAFNQANSLLMGGKYADSIKRYDRALELRPGWGDAVTNREIAVARAESLDFEGGNMTGGKLGADGVVFDPPGASSEGEDEVVEGEGMSDEEVRAVWLRQVATTPRDFLRSKFAFQASRQSAEGGTE